MFNNLFELKEFCINIKLPGQVIEELASLFEKMSQNSVLSEKINSYVNNFCENKDLNSLKLKLDENKKENGIIILLALILSTDYTKKIYEKLNIDDKIFYDTMSDITTWATNFYEDNNFWGISEINWLIAHIQAKVFCLGRLQFELTTFHKPESIGLKNILLETGDFTIDVHVPQGSKLDNDECEKSYQHALTFFEKYFPEHTFKAFHCHSWLLWRGLVNLIPKSSNIIRFQNKFTIIHEDNDGGQTLERVFGRNYKKLALNEYPLDTSLQKSIFLHIKNGNSLGSAVGIILKKDM